jgi:hypothetical protein
MIMGDEIGERLSGRSGKAWTQLSEALAVNPYYRNDTLAAAAWAEIAERAQDPWMVVDDRRVPAAHRRAVVSLLDLVSRYRPAWAFPHPPVAPMLEWADRIMRGESEAIMDWQFAVSESLHTAFAEQDRAFGDRLYRFYQKVLVMAPDLIRARIMLLLVRGHPDGSYRIRGDIGLLREALGDPHTTSSVLYLAGRDPGLAKELGEEILHVFSHPGTVNLDPHLTFYTTAFPVEEITRRAIAWDVTIFPAGRIWVLGLMADPRYMALRDALRENLPAWYREFPETRLRYWRLAAQRPELDLFAMIGLDEALSDPSFLAYLARVRVPAALPFLIRSFRQNYQMIIRGDGGWDIVQALGRFKESEIRGFGELTDVEWAAYRGICATLSHIEER